MRITTPCRATLILAMFICHLYDSDTARPKVSNLGMGTLYSVLGANRLIRYLTAVTDAKSKDLG